MRLPMPESCPVCGAGIRKRSSRKMAEGYYVNYIECKNPSCDAKLKINEEIRDSSDVDIVDDIGLKQLIPQACALVIIDQQRADDYYPVFRKRNNPDAEERMALLLEAWRKHELPIIHVRHISSEPDSSYAPGHPGAGFKKGFEPLAGEHVANKSVSDAFTRSGLESWLVSKAIRQLVVIGSTSEGAVESTVRNAASLGFTVWVPDDACYTFEKLGYHAEVIAPAWVHTLAMTNLHQGNSTVVDTTLVLHALEHATD